jgi:pentatricopeptide repeat protein
MNCKTRHAGGRRKEEGFVLVSLLKSYAKDKDLLKGITVHDEIVKKGLLRKSAYIASALIHMYVRCGALRKAQEVLDELPVRDVISWSALIAGYARQGKGHEALHNFEQMQNEGLSADPVTFTCLLKACGITRSLGKGKRIHEEIVSRGMLKENVVLGGALVDMYVKCHALEKARQVLKQIPFRDAVAWSSLIAGCVQQGRCHEALKCFEQMQSEGLAPDAIAFTCALKACGSIGAIERGKRFHDAIISAGLLEKDIALGNALVDMYAKCGLLARARRALKELPVRDAIGWNALIAGFIQHGEYNEALDCFQSMQSEGSPSPDAVTFVCVLKACGSIGAVEKGKHIHDEVVLCEGSPLQKDVALGTALVDMYAKCGELPKAWEVHEALPIQTVVSWSALIAGYAQHGQGHAALECFKQMRSKGHRPNEVTFVCVLSACARLGLLNEAYELFGEMSRRYGIDPNREHHTCMVVILSCAGRFDEAQSMMNATTVASSDRRDVWLALLGACRKWANVKLGRLVFDHAVRADDARAPAAYVLMADLFSDAGMLEDAEKVEAVRQKYATPVNTRE